MQFEWLEVFCEVVRQRSFSQAAQVHNLTQSAASQIVSQLEKRLAVQLIDRSTRPLQPTPLGKAYFEGCKVLLGQYTQLEASLRAAQDEVGGSLQVAAIYSVGLGDMDQTMQRFQTEQPNVKVQLEYLHPRRVYERVLDGTADLGLVSFPRKSSKLTHVPWREEAMVVAAAPDHLLTRQAAVRAADLDGVKYIHFDKDLQIRREVDRFLRDQGAHVEVVLEFDNIENIKKAIEIGAGVALLPEPTLRREMHGGSLVGLPLAGERLTRPLGIIHRRQPPSSAARRFIDLLCAQEGATGADGAGRPVQANGIHRTSPTTGKHSSRNGTERTRRKKV
jgi:DNA-binding transcriptional LysR family regulator